MLETAEVDDLVYKTASTVLNPPAGYARHFPSGGFDPILQAFARIALELQERRHEADYDPRSRLNVRNTLADIAAARTAVAHFRAAP